MNGKSSELGLVNLRDPLDIQMEVLHSQSRVQGRVSVGVSIAIVSTAVGLDKVT